MMRKCRNFAFVLMLCFTCMGCSPSYDLRACLPEEYDLWQASSANIRTDADGEVAYTQFELVGTSGCVLCSCAYPRKPCFRLRRERCSIRLLPMHPKYGMGQPCLPAASRPQLQALRMVPAMQQSICCFRNHNPPGSVPAGRIHCK